jgi:hypothetical protein
MILNMNVRNGLTGQGQTLQYSDSWEPCLWPMVSDLKIFLRFFFKSSFIIFQESVRIIA